MQRVSVASNLSINKVVKMLRSDVSEKVGNTQSLNAITEVVNVLSIHFAFVKPFINAWNELGFSCENDNVSVFIGTAGS